MERLLYEFDSGNVIYQVKERGWLGKQFEYCLYADGVKKMTSSSLRNVLYTVMGIAGTGGWLRKYDL